jgi:hypothetical protein
MRYLNFIETYLGLSPDGGDGSWEIAALVPLVGLGALVGLLWPIGKPNGKKHK